MDKNRRGVSLIEALFVLGIIAILIGMVMILYSHASERRQMNELKDELLEFKYAVDALYPNGILTGDVATAVTESGFMSNKYLYGAGVTIFHDPLGGAITITNPGDGTALNALNIWVWYLTKEQCIELSTTDFGTLMQNRSINYQYDSGSSTTSATNAEANCKDGNANYMAFNMEL